MTSAIERLRELLDERGVKWDTFSVSNTEYIHWTNSDGHWCEASIGGPLSLHVSILSATPEQAIAATLGASDATGERQDAAKVYLVEVSDELIESWYPLGVYLNKESAEDCAEAYRRKEDGVFQFARVSELKVVDE